MAEQYAGGLAGRVADIEAGCRRPAAELVDDVATSARRLEAAWASTSEHTWATGRGRPASDGLWAVADLPFYRWREVEIHHVDLGLSYGVADWPEDYVEAEWARTLAGLAERLDAGAPLALEATDTGERLVVPPGAQVPSPVVGPRRALLAWLVGRGEMASAPALAPWQPQHRKGAVRPG